MDFVFQNIVARVWELQLLIFQVSHKQTFFNIHPFSLAKQDFTTSNQTTQMPQIRVKDHLV
jgi:hypothetical protein